MTNLHHTTSDQAAPVHSTVAIRLALCALLGLIAALVDLLAVVGRRGALAGVPLLVVFTISGAVPRKPVSLLWFALSAAGFLILLALDSSDDLQRWGHYVPRPTRAGRRAANAVSAQRIAGAAIVLAVVLPIFIPAELAQLRRQPVPFQQRQRRRFRRRRHQRQRQGRHRPVRGAVRAAQPKPADPAADGARVVRRSAVRRGEG